MGVYIDMEMPQNCQSCNFYNGLGCNATGRMFSLLYNLATRRSDCPLIEVQEPHGRLIDADKLNEEVRLLIKENMFSHDDARDLLETIADAPTIIPASEEGET